MFHRLRSLSAPVTALFLSAAAAGAVTFTNDTAISADNTNYDGLDVLITNCTLTLDGAHSFASLQVLNGSRVICESAEGTSRVVVRVMGDLLVASNGWMVLSNEILWLSGNGTVEGGGGIVADGAGCAGGIGPGAGQSCSSTSGYVGGGGGYGGYGAAGASTASNCAYGGTPYGSVISPVSLGSGGGGVSSNGISGGAGGGAIHLVVFGTLHLDGRISARGLAGTGLGAGGGSGGSIIITLYGMTLTGTGLISADGGPGNGMGGGGGGGRIAINYLNSTFSGLISAYGGGGYAVGGAGTIFVPGRREGMGLVCIDNGGQVGANTAWPAVTGYDLTIRNGACLALTSSPPRLNSLTIGSNAWVYVTGSAGLGGSLLNVSSNATIQAGGGMIADGGGYSYSNGGTGPGAGGYVLQPGGYVGSGGGFGGSGGASGGSPPVVGGKANGSVTAWGAGSAGGTYGTNFVGGAGGGVVNLYVSGTLQVDGRISSAGSAGISMNAGRWGRWGHYAHGWGSPRLRYYRGERGRG